jgi:hypothetical protein
LSRTDFRPRRRDLDGLDLGVRALVADGVHQPGGLEHQQPGLLDRHPGLGDPVLDHALLGQRLAEGDARRRPRHISSSARSAAPIRRMQWWMRPGPSRAWAIANPPPSSPIRFVAGTRTSVEDDLGVAAVRSSV